MKHAATKAQKEYRNRVAELGCSLCRRIGFPGTPAQLHHPRSHTGMGLRSDERDLIPLCYEHHLGDTGVHMLGKKGMFEAMYGFTEKDLINDTRELLDDQ